MKINLSPWLLPPEYRKYDSYKAARKWHQGLSPQNDRDYNLELEYARDKYKEVAGIFSSLEAKAERFWKFSIALAGIVIAVARLSQLAEFNLWSITAAISFAASAALCILVCHTAGAALPMSIQKLIDEKPDSLPMQLAGSYHCAIEGTRIINDWKAKRCDYAMWFLIAGVVLSIVWIVGT